MCTLIIGLDTAAPGSVMLAANRDEDPARPSEPPGVLIEEPRVVGGRDVLKGGTWLAIRERRAALAMLNRREDRAASDPGRRSRGLLALEAAAAGDGTAVPALEFAFGVARNGAFAPFSMVFASPDVCWLLSDDGAGKLEVARVRPGWHALTHSVLDDPGEPRTAWLAGQLARFAPRSPAEAERGLLALLRAHGGSAGPGEEPAPPVCLHQGRMVTVSSAIVFIARDELRYLHIEGRPCEHEALDCSQLTAGRSAAAETS